MSTRNAVWISPQLHRRLLKIQSAMEHRAARDWGMKTIVSLAAVVEVAVNRAKLPGDQTNAARANRKKR